MKKVLIDEYLTQKIRNKIDELVDLNLGEDAIFSLLSNELYGYDDYMILEIRRYIMYVIWLNDKNKDKSNAFEKYKKRIEQIASTPEENIPPTNLQDEKNHLDRDNNNEALVAQRRKEQARIEELSKMMRDSYEESQPIIPQKIDANKIMDQVIDSMSDEELQETLTIMLDKDPTINKDFGDIFSDYDKDESLNDFTLSFEEKQKIFNSNHPSEASDLELNQTLYEIETDDKTTTITLESKTEEITFKDIVDEQSASFEPTYSINPEIFDSTLEEDNGTQNLDDTAFFNHELEEFETNDEDDQNVETQQAFDFLKDMEAKYGTDTIITLNEKEYGFPTTSNVINHNGDLKIGNTLNYKNKDYVIYDIKDQNDFFGNLQTIIYLRNENNEEIKLNSKKIK
ncbi:hypothetical protein [Williamsoniiplasma luminosum]|uniref:Uncharacterized protein n=1 Tax=Williamsoniiplasma luminosum TaxID=214888 RepID=A0A2S0NJG3_9MOLU|nr:hypothetical protein [Williamsoniiplasma luminosum]AVP49149.1 MAG: hypothetical protein C5T88_00940 [Williamsoniiplasma luminosum]